MNVAIGRHIELDVWLALGYFSLMNSPLQFHPDTHQLTGPGALEFDICPVEAI